MFEDSAHHLDVLIATQVGHESSSTDLQDGTEFQRYIDRLQPLTRLTEQANEVADQIDFYESLVTWNTLRGEGEDEDEDPTVAAMREEIETLKTKAAEMVLSAKQKTNSKVHKVSSLHRSSTLILCRRQKFLVNRRVHA